MSALVQFAPGWQNGRRPKFVLGQPTECACGFKAVGFKMGRHRETCAAWLAWLKTVPPPPEKENPDQPRIRSVFSGLTRAINAPTKRETDILLMATRDFIMAGKKDGNHPVIEDRT